jgi:PKD repeat protein
VTVTAANVAPTAGFTHTTTDLTATLTDTSSDTDGSVVSWSWDFGEAGGTSTAQNPSHTYASAGTYTVTLTVMDDDGATNSTSQSVTVTAPVIVGSITPNTAQVGQALDVTVTGSGFAQGATLSFESGNGPAPVVTSIEVSADGLTLTATVEVKSGGPRRDRVWDVRVTNPNGGTGVLSGGFTITP